METIDLKTLLLLLLLRKEGTIGRYRLKEMLDMQRHEGVVRRILEDLTEKQWLRPTRSGCVLTRNGEETIAKLLRERGMVDVQWLDLRGADIGPTSAVIQLRNRRIAASILTLRDAAVKAGARGAIILAYRSGELGDPSAYTDLSEKHPEITQILRKNLKLREGDTIVASFAEKDSKALEGALAAALELTQSETEK